MCIRNSSAQARFDFHGSCNIETRTPMHLWLIKLLHQHLMPFIFDIDSLSPGDKKEKDTKRRLKTSDVQVKNLMSALGKMIEPL